MSEEARPTAAESSVGSKKRRRRGLTIGLRSFMLLVLVLGFVFQWIYAARKQHQDVRAVEAEGGFVFYPWELKVRKSEYPHTAPNFPTFLTEHLPVDYFFPVVAVHFDHPGIDPRIVRRVGQFRQLQELEVSRTPINDEDLLALGGLSEMKRLELFSTKVKGPGLRVLAGMTKLEDLDLDVPMSDDTFSHISRLIHLKSLAVGAGNFSDTGLKQLDTLRELKTLRLYGSNKTTEAGFTFLESMPELTDLEIYYLPTSNLSHLRRLQKLVRLQLTYAKLSDLSHLRYLPKLMDLAMQETAIDKDEFRFLKDLPELKILDLSTDAPITDADLVYFEPLNSLETLSLSWANIRGPGLKHLANMKSLRTLYLEGNALEDDGMALLCKSKSIRVLDINDTKVTGVGLLKLKGLKSLETLIQPEGILNDDNIDYYREQLHGISLYY